MNRIKLGRTGLDVSVIGLGGGGHSRLGMSSDKSEHESVSIIRRALELGVNFIDTAEVYGTEGRIGEALQSVGRDSYYLSSKYSLYENKELRRPEAVEKSLDASLQRLKTDYIDVYHLHGVNIKDYDYAAQHLVPELIRMREKGKIRFLGITEAFASDPSHVMLQRAVQDDMWDVMMVGFNILNQSARDTVFKTTIAKNIGVLAMFAVRRALAQPEALKELVGQMIDDGLLQGREIDRDNPLGFLADADGRLNLTDIAYRFCRHEPGIHCMLSGTGNIRHLEDNIASANRGPLDERDAAALRELFAGVDSVSGN